MEFVKTFTINLDLPPETRYSKLCACWGLRQRFVSLDLSEGQICNTSLNLSEGQICNTSLNLSEGLEEPNPNTSLRNKYISMYKSFIGIIPLRESLLESIIKSNIDTIMYRDEIEYWAKIIGLPFYQVVILQLLYEINSGCTTFVTELNSLQTMIRLMDWPCEFLKEITYHGVFYSKGKPIFDAVCWIGSIGIFTARSIKSKYMVALNYRRLCNVTIHTIITAYLNTLVASAWPVSYLIRHMLETGEKYKQVVQTLETCKLVSPVYYIISSLKLSTLSSPLIIQRAPEAHSTIHRLNPIQTNCDNIGSPDNIMFSKERLGIINQILNPDPDPITGIVPSNKIKTLESVLKQTCVYPIINKDTIYICIMNANTFDSMVILDYKKL
jgi:hypothetical protein